jgi:hypothetical protein
LRHSMNLLPEGGGVRVKGGKCTTELISKSDLSRKYAYWLVILNIELTYLYKELTVRLSSQ